MVGHCEYERRVEKAGFGGIRGEGRVAKALQAFFGPSAV